MGRGRSPGAAGLLSDIPYQNVIYLRERCGSRKSISGSRWDGNTVKVADAPDSVSRCQTVGTLSRSLRMDLIGCDAGRIGLAALALA